MTPEPFTPLPPEIGFMVWNPARGMPTYSHRSLEGALREAERLTARNPGERFIIMSPVLAGPETTIAKAWSDGKAAGLSQAHNEIMRAEGISDRAQDQVHDMRRELSDLSVFKDRAAEFQSIVADCMCWFAGFDAAQAGREGWERPWTPERERLRDLNIALQNLLPASETEIPF